MTEEINFEDDPKQYIDYKLERGLCDMERQFGAVLSEIHAKLQAIDKNQIGHREMSKSMIAYMKNDIEREERNIKGMNDRRHWFIFGIAVGVLLHLGLNIVVKAILPLWM